MHITQTTGWFGLIDASERMVTNLDDGLERKRALLPSSKRARKLRRVGSMTSGTSVVDGART
jgi:hypothetical protein